MKIYVAALMIALNTAPATGFWLLGGQSSNVADTAADATGTIRGVADDKTARNLVAAGTLAADTSAPVAVVDTAAPIDTTAPIDTSAPVGVDSDAPSDVPSDAPSDVPSMAPSGFPSDAPSLGPASA